MKHLIIGAGVVGEATGTWLEANKEEVHYFDIRKVVREKFENSVDDINGFYDITWVCTAEWNVESVISTIKQREGIVIVRSTTPPGTVKRLSEKYLMDNLFHVPEFLKQATSVHDIFNPDRIVIGYTKESPKTIESFFKSLNPGFLVVTTDSTTSEAIKLVSNAYLSTLISFWNEIKNMCEGFHINPQFLSEVVCMDERISKYGSMMLGKPFSGFCLPKDLVALRKAFKETGIESPFLDRVEKTNKDMKK